MQATLLFLFFIGMLGDSYTTFIGILGGLGTQIVNPDDIGNLAFAAMGTSVITGFNLLTLDVFERKNKIIFLFWAPAVMVDFITSLIGSFTFIKPGANLLLAYFLVFIITMFITSSPAMLRYIQKNPVY
ncbi:MAG TPA: hypothetical protein DD001_19520 [Microcoleaceae bacterium UBA10368]|jgi:hypothetical protein|nr:hypothetical protein [Microcoleaceae cyanobacterium UBA10368]